MEAARERIVAAVGRAAPAEASQLTHQRRRAAWLFLVPMLVVLALVAGWPLVRTIFFSFTDANLGSLEGYKLVGADNFKALAALEKTLNRLGRNGKWSGGESPAGTAAGGQ